MPLQMKKKANFQSRGTESQQYNSFSELFKQFIEERMMRRIIFFFQINITPGYQISLNLYEIYFRNH